MVLSSNMAGVCAVYAGMHIHVCVWICVCEMDANVCLSICLSTVYMGRASFFFGKALDFHDLACHNLHQVF